MTWYDIKWGGQTYVENLSGADEKTLTALGIHGYATQAEAEANPQTMNFIQAAAGGASALAGVSGSATNITTPGGVVTGGGATAAATGGIDDFLQYPQKVLAWISNRSNIVRVAKVVIGGTMILVGLDMLTKQETNIDIGGAVTGAAKAVVK
jgi:hypothetical protein